MKRLLASLCLLPFTFAATENTDRPVSYYTDIRPMFQAACQGCHQPAKAKGDYVMTDFAAMLKGGESGDPAIVPGKPDESVIIDLITPREGMAEMPKKKPPLHETEIATIRRWITEGANDDTPESARRRYSAENPPVYTRNPMITALDLSPDDTLIAVSGFHEVLLHKRDGDTLTLDGRLIGMSERIQSLAFSPDGNRLLVVGGNPGRMGEVQIWDVAKRSLIHSIPVTYDTLYGASWSPDGSLVACGCSDTSARVFDAKTGKQVFYNAGHDDWALDTTFSKEGTHLVSVGRDMTVKAYEIDTERFLDNITSITPGALKGGVHAVVRHPARNEVLVGGADGIPKLYRMFRVKNRQIGDDSNLLLQMPPQPGRIFGLAISTNGQQLASVSSLDGTGYLHLYKLPADTKAPDDVNAVLLKPVHQRSGAETKLLNAHFEKQIQTISILKTPNNPLYTVALTQNGATACIGGLDGLILTVNTASGTITNSTPAAPLEK